MAHSAVPALMIKSGLTDTESAEFEALVTVHRAKILRFALASLRDRDAAESVTQDCFLKAFQARDRFRNACSISTWLMRIAVNLVRDHIRNRRFQFWRRTKTGGNIAGILAELVVNQQHSPEITALLQERVQVIWIAAEKLPEQQRTVFLLRFVEEMEIQEIAEATGLKEGTVKVHLFRALKAVRERVEASK